MINPFQNALDLLRNFGFFSVILPLILVFAVFFAVLEKTKIFEDVDNRQIINTIISFIAAFFVISSTPVVDAINSILPSASLLLIISMLILMLLAFWGFKTESMFGQGTPKIAIVGVTILILVFLMMIDLATNIQIPIIHQLAMSMVGRGAEAGLGASLAMSQEAIDMLISFALIFGIPIAVLIIVMWKGKTSPST